MNDKIKNKKILNVPHLRFKEFSGEWEKVELNQVANKVTKKNKDVKINETFTNSAEYGVINQKDFFDKSISNADNIDNYYVVSPNDFVYNPRISNFAPVGPINKNNLGRCGIMSPLYTIFTVKNINATFLEYYFKSNHWHYYMYCNGDNGARHDRFSISDTLFFKMTIPITMSNEQQKIATFLALIDKRIETQMKIIKEIESLKNSIVIKIFGDKSKFLNKWAKNKLSDILKERKQYAQKGSKYTHVTLSKEGVVNKTDRYNRDFLVKDEEKEYKVTKLNDICYNPANLKFGVICLNKYGDAIFSPIYVTYEINKNYNPLFIELALTNSTFIGHIRKYEQGTVYERMAVSSEDFLKGTIITPPFEDQNNIVKAFNIIDGKLEIEKSILDKLKLQKNYLLNNMFV